MRRHIYGFLLALVFILPKLVFGQTGHDWIPWPASEDTMVVPGGSNLYSVFIADTAGLSWKGADGATAWANHNRVYVLLHNQTYTFSACCTLKAVSKIIYIRGEQGQDYSIPNNTGTYRPIINFEGPSTTNTSGFFWLGGYSDTLVCKNVGFCGNDQSVKPSNVDNVGGQLWVETSSTGSGKPGVYFDSCTFQGLGCVVNTYVNTGTVRIQNCIIGDLGGPQKANLGSGRVMDGRGVEIDTISICNNTIFNIIDRNVRRLTSVGPLHNFFYNQNTVLNCLSFHGFISLGWIDSTGTGSFQIKDNLLVDNFLLGPDTDAVRAAEFTDSPDLDPHYPGGNSALAMSKMSWIVCMKQASNGNHQKWSISNNYYAITDSGVAIRNYKTPLHPIVYGVGETPEPFLTSDISTQLTANGGNPATAFTRVGIQFNSSTAPTANAYDYNPKPMTKLARFYFDPNQVSTYQAISTLPGAQDSTNGAGAGKLKNTAKPIANYGFNPGNAAFTQFTTTQNAFGRWPYDIKRMRIDSIFDWFDGSFYASSNLSTASSTGGMVGATNWSYLGHVALNTLTTGISKTAGNVPSQYSLAQNFPNPFNPTTTINYTLSKSTQTSLKVYDVLGREVATLFNGMQTAGPQTAVWDASHAASGVYFYKLVAGDFSQIRKMVLLK